VLAVALAACSIRVIDHDQSVAAARAVEFAELAFVQGAAERSHALLADDAKKMTSVAALGDLLRRIHPKARPLSVRATEFEPVPGQKLMNIFLRGENGDELFFYRVTMSGTANTGYRVAGIYRGSGPYPESKLRRKLSG
jgi:hypothetical protein